MKEHHVKTWRHPHSFGLDTQQEGEKRTLIVLVITLITMVIEIAAGIAFGSIALWADGLHMGSHALALGISVLAYMYARKFATDPRFTFGTGKINALGGFTGAVFLGGFALVMVWEGTERLFYPQPIIFDWAIFVAVFGLIVNGVCAYILGGHHHGHDHSHDHSHDHEDLNLKSAYLHVLADALTSVVAIVALLAGKYYGALWMDPLMGFLGAALILRWSYSLIKETGMRLLDQRAPEAVRQGVKNAIESQADTEIYDLHVWLIAPGAYAAIIGVVTHKAEPPNFYKSLIPDDLNIKHLTVEVHECHDEECLPSEAAQ